VTATRFLGCLAFSVASVAAAGAACARAAAGAAPTKAAPSQATSEEDPCCRCEAGSLPRVDDKSLGEGGAAKLLALAEHGIVAVIWDGRRAEILPECKLGKPYLDIPGRTAAIHFRPANQALFVTDQITPACRRATHVVATFVSEQTGASDTKTATHVAGVMVPLPCPPVADKAPAPGCIGKGLTGAARRARAEARRAALPLDQAPSSDVARPLEIYALTPDDYSGLQYLGTLRDLGLTDQSGWIRSQFDLKMGYELPTITATLKPAARRTEPLPDVHWDERSLKLLRTPAFFWCFRDRIHPNVHFHVDP
jgi:hypothetical protein